MHELRCRAGTEVQSRYAQNRSVGPEPGGLSGTGPRPAPEPHRGGSEAGLTLGGLVAFLAIGCPICNKIVLVLLGTTGALQFFAPIQPLLGAASVVLLAATLGWRLRARARGCARCAVASSGPAIPLVD